MATQPAVKDPSSGSPSIGAKLADDSFAPAPSTSQRNLQAVQGRAPAGALSATEQARADRSRAQLSRTLEQLGLAPALRNALLAKVDHLEGPAKLKELERLEGLSSLEQGGRALATDVELDLEAAKDPRLKERLTPELRQALLEGVGRSRDPESTRGTAGVLGRAQAVEAAKVLSAMDPASAKAVTDLLARAGKGKSVQPGASAAAEQALLLKAVAARSEAFKTPAGATAALKELDAFAAELRGHPRAELMRTSTVIDVDDANTSKFDPGNPALADTDGANDGLYQRYESSCGPTVAQMVRAEADPVYARRLHAAGLNDAADKSPISSEQRKTLERLRFEDAKGRPVTLDAAAQKEFERSGRLPPGVLNASGKAISRQEYASHLVTLKAQADRARLGPESRRALERDLAGAPVSSPQDAAERANAWATVRKANGGKPADADIAALKQGARMGEGMRLEDALTEIARPATHQDARPRPFSLNDCEKQLERGVPVPLRVADGNDEHGHFMLMTDVRGAPGERQFLISDPASGRTSWISEADLDSKGASPWPRMEFGHPSTQATNAYW